jgi:hypothetical protein
MWQIGGPEEDDHRPAMGKQVKQTFKRGILKPQGMIA